MGELGRALYAVIVGTRIGYPDWDQLPEEIRDALAEAELCMAGLVARSLGVHELELLEQTYERRQKSLVRLDERLTAARRAQRDSAAKVGAVPPPPARELEASEEARRRARRQLFCRGIFDESAARFGEHKRDSVDEIVRILLERVADMGGDLEELDAFRMRAEPAIQYVRQTHLGTAPARAPRWGLGVSPNPAIGEIADQTTGDDGP